MFRRALIAIVGMPLFVWICLRGVTVFAPAVFVLAVLGLAEMFKTYRAQGLRPNMFLGSLGLLSPITVLIPSTGPWADWHQGVQYALEAAVIFALVWEVFRAAQTGKIESARDIGYGLLCGVYISLFGGLTSLRANHVPLYNGIFPHLETGAARVILAAFCVWITDTCALLFGGAFGKHKLAPNLSPGKTVEGAIGGLVGGIVTGFFLGQIFFFSSLLGMCVGAIAGVFGQIGDLFESALKREACIKDFGGILPGHGGILDRFDSLLFTAPLVYLFLQYGVPFLLKYGVRF